MKANSRFLNQSPRFWANVKLISEQAGYSLRARKGEEKTLRKYSIADAIRVYSDEEINPKIIRTEAALFELVIEYLNFRADIIQNQIQHHLMNRTEAAAAYENLLSETGISHAASMNKQKGEKRHPAYLASMVSLIAEKVIGAGSFVDDARRLSIMTSEGAAEYTFSRRFDGALPSVKNPTAVWEIKEYYGTTTFGSRVADGVYETLLDGFEINEAEATVGRRINHFLFVDDRFTWWDCGRSYLCRMVDMLHTGHVDEIFFGREVLSSWEPTLRRISGR